MQKQFIPRTKDRRSAPLSFAQQRLWFLNQLEPESSAYNTAIALRLDGALNLAALSMALDAIVERHEVLRTTYVVEESSDPIQRIGRPQVVEVSTVDLSDCPQSELDGRVQRVVSELKDRPFDLSRDLMLRAWLLRLALDQHILVVVIHHIASDGWSSGILWHELAVYYTAYSQGNSVSLPELPIQFADYAVWQREWLSGEVLASQLDYWKKQLQDLPTLQLPTDRPRPAVQSYRGAQQAFKLSEGLTQGLKKLSRDEGVTLFMTLLAAFQTLLSRYSGQEDICIGLPIANRKYVEIEGLIGFFVNTLVLRSDLSGKPTFRELLSKVKWTALQSYAHQDLPFEKLVEELQPERNLGVSPLFQVMFALQNYPRTDFAWPGLAVSPIVIHSNAAKFDLSLALTETTDGFEGQLEYSTDLFDPTTVARMIVHFQTLLEGVVANPDQRISELPLLTEAEKHQLVVEWNDTKRDYPSDKCIHQLFEEQVEHSPDSIALVFEDRRVTYRELNIKANQLAHHLRKQGVGPDVLVAICMERSVEMAIGLLGILKAGGAYVPLDPTYPSERLAFLLKDAAIRVLIGQERLIAGFDLDGIQAVCIDRDWGLIAEESDESPAANGRAEQLAYVIYTSGSTGKPKGVAVPHRGLVNLATWHQRVYGVTVSDRATQLASPAFDASIWEIWPYLISGASLWIPDEETRLIPEKLVEWLADQKITLSFLPTPLAEAVIRLPGLERLSLRALLTGGDRLHPLPNSSFSFKLVNHYGPTEASVVTTFASVEGELHGKIAPPIGRPIANIQVYILDSNMNPAPIGVVGELHIGGEGLARGYLDRPELTKEKFIGNPFSTDPTSRLYKTGDLARYLPDGNIEFLGRIDNQVKVRGYRIELGEIEAVLGQHPAIREAVVLAREDSSGDRRLVAYVVAPPETSTNELRSFLKQKLPEFMVPSAFVCLDSLPLTPNGKVDRRALPAPDPSRPDLDETFSLLRTPTEELLANIWAEVLKLEKVGIHDNFFDMGGHSLLATQIVSRVRSGFSVELPLRDLFEAPTVYALAQRVQDCREKRNIIQEAKITRVAREQYRVQQTK